MANNSVDFSLHLSARVYNGVGRVSNFAIPNETCKVAHIFVFSRKSDHCCLLRFNTLARWSTLNSYGYHALKMATMMKPPIKRSPMMLISMAFQVSWLCLFSFY